MPEEIAGVPMPTNKATIASTINSSIRVTPRSLARLIVVPTDDVGINAVSTRLAVGAVAGQVGVVSMIARKLVYVWVAPRIVCDILLKVRTLPVVRAIWLHAQGLQALLRRRIDTRIELV